MYYNRARAREFQKYLRVYEDGRGRRIFRHARVRRVNLTVWGCAS